MCPGCLMSNGQQPSCKDTARPGKVNSCMVDSLLFRASNGASAQGARMTPLLEFAHKLNASKSSTAGHEASTGHAESSVECVFDADRY